MRDETTVVITIAGVRKERLPRLRTVVKSHLQVFGREVNVDDGEADGEQAMGEVDGQGASDGNVRASAR
jgi:hypothetical protein